MATIDFFFELASPYSYLASHQIDRIAAEAGHVVAWRPIDLEAVWQAHGVLEAYAAVRRVKRAHIFHDAQRCAQELGLTLARPVTRVAGTALAKLAFHGLNSDDGERAKRFIRAVWHRHFAEGQPIDEPQDLAAAHGALDADAIVRAAQSPSAREAQDVSTAEALRSGCFGVPWLVFDGEAYFGHDRLPHLERHLRR
ncbi:DsbA family protein [Aquincola sp. S2]|uniref:2-hydroxychromene-2-carboxylate isomerase n=1 Tax=Pseudaquabacterium terrae TaxID=2732868 RepID=A0ABX2EJD7_9BURK|nr:DsbA family protein [Aquabacterium terrae]NRF68762.1 DsbA family protein [Aquabacterium terrae]